MNLQDVINEWYLNKSTVWVKDRPVRVNVYNVRRLKYSVWTCGYGWSNHYGGLCQGWWEVRNEDG